MPDPISNSTAVGIAGWKLAGGAAGVAGLAALVVMLMTWPETKREVAAALISTIIGSICGGAALVMWLGLQWWVNSYIGLLGLGGLIFACGLPAWLVVRWMFRWLRRHQDSEISKMLRDLGR